MKYHRPLIWWQKYMTQRRKLYKLSVDLTKIHIGTKSAANREMNRKVEFERHLNVTNNNKRENVFLGAKCQLMEDFGMKKIQLQKIKQLWRQKKLDRRNFQCDSKLAILETFGNTGEMEEIKRRGC